MRRRLRKVEAQVLPKKPDTPEVNFHPEKVGFLKWECKVKIPGKAGEWEAVTAWTGDGAVTRAARRQADLLDAYMKEKGPSVAIEEDAMTEEAPDDSDLFIELGPGLSEEELTKRLPDDLVGNTGTPAPGRYNPVNGDYKE